MNGNDQAGHDESDRKIPPHPYSETDTLLGTGTSSFDHTSGGDPLPEWLHGTVPGKESIDKQMFHHLFP